MTAVLTTPTVCPGQTGWCLTTLLQTWLHAPKAKGSPNSTQNRKDCRAVCLPNNTHILTGEWDSSLSQELQPKFSENNWETSKFQKTRIITDKFCSAGLAECLFQPQTPYEDWHVSSAPCRRETGDSAVKRPKSWVKPENGFSTNTERFQVYGLSDRHRHQDKYAGRGQVLRLPTWPWEKTKKARERKVPSWSRD